MKSPNEKLSVGLLFDDSIDVNDGAAQQVKRIGEWLSSNGHQVVYLSGETKLKSLNGCPVFSLSRNIEVTFNGNRVGIPWYCKRRDIKTALDQAKLDVIHVAMPYSPTMGQRVIAEAYRRNIPIVATFHILPYGLLATLGSRLLGLLQFGSVRKLAVVTAGTQPAADFARTYFNVGTQVIPHMLDVGSFRVKQPPTQTQRIVFLGRLVPRKGCRELVDAFSLIANDLPSAQLVIAGDGPERARLIKQVERMKLVDRIEFLGRIDESVKARLLASARVACFPSLSGESFGVVLLEAMAAGSGSIAAGDNPGYRAVLKDQPELLVDPKDSTKFAVLLKDLLTNDKRVEAIHQWLTQSVGQYDTDVVVPQMVELYRQAVAKRAKLIHN